MSSATAACLSKQREALRISEAPFEGCQAPGVLPMASTAFFCAAVQRSGSSGACRGWSVGSLGPGRKMMHADER